jgi:hypothetical protein
MESGPLYKYRRSLRPVTNSCTGELGRSITTRSIKISYRSQTGMDTEIIELGFPLSACPPGRLKPP